MVGLAAELETLSDTELAALLVRRPDLATATTFTFTDLAARASAPYSLQACLLHVRYPVRQVLDGLAFLGEPSSLADVIALARDAPDRGALLACLEEARHLGLVMRVDRSVAPEKSLWTIAPALKRSLGTPFGLRAPLARVLDRYTAQDLRVICGNLALEVGGAVAPTKPRMIAAIVEDLSDSARVLRLAADAPSDAFEFLGGVMSLGGVIGIETAPYAASQLPEGLRWLFGHALLTPLDWETVIIAREVMIGLRSGHPVLRFDTEPPAAIDRPTADQLKRKNRVEFGPVALLETIASLGPPMVRDVIRPLKTEGMGVRDVRMLAKTLGTDDATMARLLDLAGLLALIGLDGTLNRLAPRPSFEEWLRISNVERWFSLVEAWKKCSVSLSRTLVGDNRMAPLSPSYYVDENSVWRRALVVRAMLDTEPGSVIDTASIEASANWRAPGRFVDTGDSLAAVEAIIDEVSLLGLLRDGVLTNVGRAALCADSPDDPLLVAEAVSLFPPPISTFTVQADLTAVAPSELEPQVRSALSNCAEIESRGAATVFRFTEASIRRAFDQRMGRDEIVAFLERHAIPSVPQSLRYMIDDVARRYGSVVIGNATSFLRVTDEALLAELLRAKKTQKLKLEAIAPTVAISTLTSEKLLVGLREAGYLPVIDAASVTVERAASAPGVLKTGWQLRHNPTQINAIWSSALRETEGASLDGFAPAIIDVVRRLRYSAPPSLLD